MFWKRIFGMFLLLTAFTMAFLLVAKLPAIDANRFPVTNPVEAPYGISNFQNITLKPLGNEEYHVDVAISPYGNRPMQVDFWVVNKTGLGMLEESLSYSVLKTEYPDKAPFNSIKSHAREINITNARQIELTNLDHDGTYCLVLVNFFEDYLQNITLTVEEKYLGSSRTLLEPNPANLVFVPTIAVIGGYFAMASRRRPSRRVKITTAKTQRALHDLYVSLEI